MTEISSETPMTIEELAAVAFEPWPHGAEEWKPPSNDQWAHLANPHLISVRLAWLTVHKTRDELIAMADTLGDDGVAELVAQIGRSADWFKGMHVGCCRARRHTERLTRVSLDAMTALGPESAKRKLWRSG